MYFPGSKIAPTSYLGGWDWEDWSLKPTQANILIDSHLQNKQSWRCSSKPVPSKKKKKKKKTASNIWWYKWGLASKLAEFFFNLISFAKQIDIYFNVHFKNDRPSLFTFSVTPDLVYSFVQWILINNLLYDGCSFKHRWCGSEKDW
jgi:hypothetical protein